MTCMSIYALIARHHGGHQAWLQILNSQMLCHGKRQTITKFFDVTNGMLNLTQLLVGDTVSQHYLSAHSLPCKAQVLLLRNWCSIHQSSPAVSPAVKEATSALVNSSIQQASAWPLPLPSSGHWRWDRLGTAAQPKGSQRFKLRKWLQDRNTVMPIVCLKFSCTEARTSFRASVKSYQALHH